MSHGREIGVIMTQLIILTLFEHQSASIEINQNQSAPINTNQHQHQSTTINTNLHSILKGLSENLKKWTLAHYHVKSSCRSK